MEMDGNGWKWLNMDGNGWKRLEMDGNAWIGLELVGIGFKCLEMARYVWKWQEWLQIAEILLHDFSIIEGFPPFRKQHFIHKKGIRSTVRLRFR